MCRGFSVILYFSIFPTGVNMCEEAEEGVEGMNGGAGE
jgi:hypothetical protein